MTPRPPFPPQSSTQCGLLHLEAEQVVDERRPVKSRVRDRKRRSARASWRHGCRQARGMPTWPTLLPSPLAQRSALKSPAGRKPPALGLQFHEPSITCPPPTRSQIRSGVGFLWPRVVLLKTRTLSIRSNTVQHGSNKGPRQSRKGTDTAEKCFANRPG